MPDIKVNGIAAMNDNLNLEVVAENLNIMDYISFYTRRTIRKC